MSFSRAPKSLGDRVGDVVFKAVTGSLFATTVVSGV